MDHRPLTNRLVPGVLVLLALSGFLFTLSAEETRSHRKNLSPLTISDVTTDRKAVDPSKAEGVRISCDVSRPAKGIVKVFDPDMYLVKELLLEPAGYAEHLSAFWDAKDLEGRFVPDEAYFFNIEASDVHGNFAFYDPTVVSGGEAFSAESLRFDRTKGVIGYHLSRDSRVAIRAGITRGPLLKNVLVWSPRLAGDHEEAWDGRDESSVIDVLDQKGSRLTVEAVSLPQNSILVNGNAPYDFLTYKNDLAPDRPKKADRLPSRGVAERLAAPSGMPDRWGPEPRLRIDLPKVIKGGGDVHPVVAGRIPIRILLEETTKRYITAERYEVVFFVDFSFVTEVEEGYSPMTFFWDTRTVENGPHVITVNVVTLTGRIGCASASVIVQN